MKFRTTRVISGIVGITAGLFLSVAAQAADAPLRIGVTIWPGWMPWWIVEKEGFFKKVGVDAEIVHFKRHSDGMAAFAAKKLDGHHMILADVIVPASQGVPGRVVLITDESSGADGIVAKTGIETPADFKGKRVAYEFGGVSQLILTEALNRAGLSFDDITSVNMAAEDAGSAFLAGAVDVAVTWEPYLSQSQTSGKGEVVFSTKETPGLVPDLMVFRQETIAARPDDVKKVIEAWNMALAYMKSNPVDAMKIMADGAGVTPEEMAENLKGIKLYTLDDNVAAFGTAPDGDFFKTAASQAEFLKTSGFIDTVPDVPALIDPSFVKAAVDGK